MTITTSVVEFLFDLPTEFSGINQTPIHPSVGTSLAEFKPLLLPKGCHGQTVDSVTNGTMAGTFTSDQVVLLHGITFPEFSSSITYEEISAHIFHSLCCYNIVFGQDVCHLLGIHLNFEDNLMEFKDQTLLMKEYPSDASLSTLKLSQELLLDWLDDNILDNTTASVLPISNDDVYTSDTNDNAAPHLDTINQSDDNIAMGSRYHSKTIKESSYNSQSIEDVVSSCTHLSNKIYFTFSINTRHCSTVHWANIPTNKSILNYCQKLPLIRVTHIRSPKLI